MRRPKYFNERSRRLSSSEEKALIEAARADENPYIEPAIILALETAMRRSELLTLTADDSDLQRRQIHVRESKNGRARVVPMTRRAMSVLQSLMNEANERLLHLAANALKLAFFRRVIPASKLEDFHFHDLRHEAISRLAESGRFQLIELQAVSGHRDVRMLLRYAHLCSGNLADKRDSVSTSSEETYLHRGRKRRKGKKADRTSLPGAAAEVSGDISTTARTIVEAVPVEQGAPLPSNLIAFPVRRVA